MSLDALYPVITDCFGLEKQIQILKQDIDYYRKKGNSGAANDREKILKHRQELFLVLGCPAKVEAKRQADTKNVFDKFAEQAKSRINTDSFSTRNVYIGIAAVVITVATIIIVKNRT